MAMGSFLYIMKLLNREKEVNMDENIETDVKELCRNLCWNGIV